MKIKRSQEFWEGYNYMGPKLRNPYAAGQPWLSEFPEKKILRKINDWDAGWSCKFHGDKLEAKGQV